MKDNRIELGELEFLAAKYLLLPLSTDLGRLLSLKDPSAKLQA